jgi:hypothetical protein
LSHIDDQSLLSPPSQERPNGMQGCGNPVCGPCNFRHGNKNVFWCPAHSVSDESSMQPFKEDGLAGKENVPVEVITCEKHHAEAYSSKGGIVLVG